MWRLPVDDVTHKGVAYVVKYGSANQAWLVSHDAMVTLNMAWCGGTRLRDEQDLANGSPTVSCGEDIVSDGGRRIWRCDLVIRIYDRINSYVRVAGVIGIKLPIRPHSNVECWRA